MKTQLKRLKNLPTSSRNCLNIRENSKLARGSVKKSVSNKYNCLGYYSANLPLSYCRRLG